MNQYYNTQDELRALRLELEEVKQHLVQAKSAITEMRALLIVGLDLDEHIDLGGESYDQ